MTRTHHLSDDCDPTQVEHMRALGAPPEAWQTAPRPQPPRPEDIQRRCWTITDTGQCVLFNGHAGSHQWAIAAPAASDGLPSVEREIRSLVAGAIGDNEGCPHHYGNLGYTCSCTVTVPDIENILAALWEPGA